MTKKDCMNKSNNFYINLPEDYYGRILSGKFSDLLKNHVDALIREFRAFDELGSLAMPYISAWQDKQNIIWYEFVSKRFIGLLECDYHEAPDFFRQSIIERHRYGITENNDDPQEEILKKDQVKVLKSELRKEAINRGSLDAVYKISTGGGAIHWLKDQANLQAFESDGITISLGNLCIVTKEMEAEERLKQAQEELRKSEHNFREQAIHDNLTGLYNTRYLYSALSGLIEQSKLSKKPFSLIFMDIDNFKHVVDTHGHLNASLVLQEIGSTIQRTLKTPKYGVAYGGDEFVLILPDSNKQQAIDTAEVIRQKIKDTPYLQEKRLNVHVTASLGVSTYPDDASSTEGLLALADHAMFSVKERGKDLVCGFNFKNNNEGLSDSKISYNCDQ